MAQNPRTCHFVLIGHPNWETLVEKMTGSIVILRTQQPPVVVTLSIKPWPLTAVLPRTVSHHGALVRLTDCPEEALTAHHSDRQTDCPEEALTAHHWLLHFPGLLCFLPKDKDQQIFVVKG